MTNPGDERDPDRTELLATRSPAVSAGGEATLPPGMRVGRYRIEALLGRGGMGEVYRAQQLEPVRRTVALKLLRARAMDVRRKAHFEVERQVLAQMRHPAIARIHDADTTPDGHPFFAMEYIDGAPITHYCEEHALSLAQRLALFIEVCEGVQHAHQKGVIHRDLKPGNLLVDEVDGRPHPKIIDFGIATATGAGAGREIAGTPEYMSPEQAAGDQSLLDTRSDVYSLGVVLSELLTGRRPLAQGETHTADSHTLPCDCRRSSCGAWLPTKPNASPGHAASRCRGCGACCAASWTGWWPRPWSTTAAAAIRPRPRSPTTCGASSTAARCSRCRRRAATCCASSRAATARGSRPRRWPCSRCSAAWRCRCTA
ncbi:serine/threonine-protein kinase [Luteimonas wenzhouensis]|nr:serine/threonine-protein kinase [Luteimonas wenzhouensis]